MIQLSIPGNPKSQLRPRLGKKGVYNPSKQHKVAAQWSLAIQYSEEPLEEPLEILLEFYFSAPASSSKKKQNQMYNGDIPHTKKPDIDNLIKLTLDAMNGIVFKDDSLVVKISAVKRYSATPQTIIYIKPIKEEDYYAI